MDNPQGKTNELNIAWLAGFIDGEGSFDLQKAYSKAVRKIESWRPRVRVSNTDIPTLDIVTKILDPMQVGYWVGWRHPTNPKYLKSWSVEIVGMKKGLRFLQIITPYLHTKQDKAELLMEFAQSRLSLAATPGFGNGHAPYSEREVHIISLVRGAAR